MVNYCCVYGCGRNTKTSGHLSFYKLPNEKHRQVEWLKAAGREDLLKTKDSNYFRFRRICSRHFNLTDVKNRSRHLAPDAVPTLFLPGQWEEEKSDDEHMDIVCNNCKKTITRFRYKCVTCDDFDLCRNCEALGAHPEHFVLRIPKPLKFKLADNLIKKWRKFFKAEHVLPDAVAGSEHADLTAESSDDDQPITKYASNYDSGVDLSEDVKQKIRKEIRRVTNLSLEQLKKAKKAAQKKKEDKKRPAKEDLERERVLPSKRLKTEEAKVTPNSNVPEMVFADVNDVEDNQLPEMKQESTEFTNLMSISTHSYPGPSTLPSETLPSTSVIPQVAPSMELTSTTFPEIAAVPALSNPDMQQPVMHVKLSDDLTELMIEVTSNNQRTIYKIPDGNN